MDELLDRATKLLEKPSRSKAEVQALVADIKAYIDFLRSSLGTNMFFNEILEKKYNINSAIARCNIIISYDDTGKLFEDVVDWYLADVEMAKKLKNKNATGDEAALDLVRALAGVRTKISYFDLSSPTIALAQELGYDMRGCYVKGKSAIVYHGDSTYVISADSGKVLENMKCDTSGVLSESRFFADVGFLTRSVYTGMGPKFYSEVMAYVAAVFCMPRDLAQNLVDKKASFIHVMERWATQRAQEETINNQFKIINVT